SKSWRIERIAKVDLAILRLAIYELLFIDDIPAKVTVNEAVELAKKYSDEKSYQFVNGLLGGYLRSGDEK
ncbi:MAG: transcription antitermination factor NusB, partial [Christensenella sp.]